MSSIFVLRARAAQIMLHLPSCWCRNAAKKPVIHTNRRKHQMNNPHTADFSAVETITFDVRLIKFQLFNQTPLRPDLREMRAACIDEILDQAARARFVVSD